jgi:coenzyme Q-binding protein COQ10
MHIYETIHPVGHSAEDMYALIAKLEDYPKFLPLCEELTVKSRRQENGRDVLIATMVVGYKLLREGFTTQVSLDHGAHTILVQYLDGPFSHLENRWRFEPVTAQTCNVDFYIAYSFRSRLFERLMGGLFSKAVRKYTAAFEARADAVYGRAPARPAALASSQQ